MLVNVAENRPKDHRDAGKGKPKKTTFTVMPVRRLEKTREHAGRGFTIKNGRTACNV